MSTTEKSPSRNEGGKGASEGDDRAARLEAKLETYKQTLKEIYDLYDKKIEELSLIRRIGDSIRAPLDLETLCRKVIDAVAQEISADRLAILLLDPARNQLLIRSCFDALEDDFRYFGENEAVSAPLDRGGLYRAAQERQPAIVEASCFDDAPFAPESVLPASVLYLPLVARNETVGVFGLLRPPSWPFEEDDIRILSIISDQAATALANVQLVGDLAAANIDLKESERQARHTSLYLENLLETAGDVIFTLDQAGAITYVNQKVAEWGYTKEDLTGTALADLSVNPRAIVEGISNQGRELIETVFLTRNGERRDVLLTPSPILDGREQSAAWLVLARDITEKKHLEKQLFHSEKLASIGILAAGVAHEVGNPLSAISGYSQILMSGGIPDEEAREYLEAIESQTGRIQRIIKDLLDYSKPSAGVSSDVNLAEALPTIMSMLTAQKAFRNIEVKYDLADEVPPVHLDQDQLTQVIINIALNAAQAMEKGGTLTISLTREENQAVISLADSGPGIPPDTAGRIFDPFFTTKTVGQGTGLGLSICHRIIENYHGAIDLDTEPGQGATFIIRLPLS